MHHQRMKLVLAALLLAALPAAGLAQSTETSGQASGVSTAKAALDRESPAAQASATADAKAKAEAEARLQSILARGAKTSAKARASAETKLQVTAQKVDDEATNQGDERVATRLAAEFGTTADALIAEKQSLGASWGELMIAHTLMANADGQLTLEQLFEMRKDGGWGQIAAGLGLRLGEVVSAVMAEGRVAAGLAKADGKVQPIHGEGANAHASAGLGVQAGTAGIGAGAKGGLGIGVGVKPGRP